MNQYWKRWKKRTRKVNSKRVLLTLVALGVFPIVSFAFSSEACWQSCSNWPLLLGIVPMHQDVFIYVELPHQRLTLYKHGKKVASYSVSTGKKGAGEVMNSEQTPRGWHCVCQKIGEKLPANTVFRSREPTGEIYTPDLGAQYPDRDWILSRILWLEGLEPGKNLLGEVDSKRRYIYIHGTSEESVIGTPSSHGCIRMRNEEVIELFNQVPVGTRVLIVEDP